MADQDQREQESRESDVTKFEEVAEEVREDQEEAAQSIGKELEPREDE